MSFSINKESIKYLETPRGAAYTANLFYDAEFVGIIYNAGNGGSTSCDYKSEKREEFSKKIKAIASSNKAKSAEPVSDYFENLMNITEGVYEPSEDEYLVGKNVLIGSTNERR